PRSPSPQPLTSDAELLQAGYSADRLDCRCANQIATVCGAEPPRFAIPELHNRHVGIRFSGVPVQTQACNLRVGIAAAPLVPATTDAQMVDNSVGAQVKSGGDLTRQCKKNADAGERHANDDDEPVGEQGDQGMPTLIGHAKQFDEKIEREAADQRAQPP